MHASPATPPPALHAPSSYSPGFADELLAAIVRSANPDPADRVPTGPSAWDDAWSLGYEIGLDLGEPDAEPSESLSPFCAAAFRDGFDRGRREAEEERLEWCRAYDEMLDGMRDGREWEEAEMAQAGIGFFASEGR